MSWQLMSTRFARGWQFWGFVRLRRNEACSRLAVLAQAHLPRCQGRTTPTTISQFSWRRLLCGGAAVVLLALVVSSRADAAGCCACNLC